MTEQDKTVLLAEKVLQCTCIKHFDDVVLTDKDGNYVQYFNPYQNWNHTHMLLEKVMEKVEMWKHLIVNISMSNRSPINELGFYMMLSKEQLMDAVISLITNA